MKRVITIFIFIILLISFYKITKEKETFTEIKTYSNKNIKTIGLKNDKLRVISEKDNEFNVINDKTQEKILSESFSGVYILSDMILGSKNNKINLFDKDGKRLLEETYDFINTLDKDIYILSRGKKNFIYDFSKKELFSFNESFENLVGYGEGLLTIKNNEFYGVKDLKGNLVIPFEYKFLDSFSNGLIVGINKNNQLIYLTKENKPLTDDNYQYIFKFDNNRGITIIDDKYGMIDEKGNIILENKYNKIFHIKENIYVIQTEKVFELYDKNGKKLTEEQYESVGEVSEKSIPIKKAGKYGIINLEGKTIIPTMYEEIGLPQNDLVIVLDSKELKYGVINLKNEYVINPNYLYIKQRNNNYFIYGDENGEEGILYKNGKELLQAKYQNITLIGENIAIGEKNDTTLSIIFLNKNKVEILDVKKENIIDFNKNEVIIQDKDGYKSIVLLEL